MKRILGLLIVVSIIPLVSLFTPGLPVTHDGQDHVVRIANFYQSLTEGNIVPRWASNLNWGFGHPILMFLYPFPSYAAALFHDVGFSFIDSTKLIFGISYVISIVCMFMWARDVWGNEAGITAAILYGFAPYRFVDLYVRGALGEHVAFIFLPVILWGLYGLSQKRKQNKWALLLSCGIAGLLLSHNAISLMMIPVAAVYFCYLLCAETKNKFQFVFLSIWAIFIGFLLAGFFWIPAFFEGKYTLRDIVTKGEVLTRMVPPSWFMYSSWNYGGGNEFSKQIGFLHWMSIVSILIVLLKTKEKKIKIFISGVLVLFLIYLLLMTEVSSSIWSRITLMQNFQFPWRLLTITLFLGSISGAIAVSQVKEKFKRPTVVFVIIFSILTSIHMWKPKEYKIYPESFFTGVYKGTTDTGESSPIWSVRFMEYQPEKVAEVAEGSAEITPIKRTTTERDYTINASEKTRIVENTLYFPGWFVIVDNQVVPVQFQDPVWRGRITYWLEPGKHTVQIVFTNTKLRTIAEYISVLGIVLCSVTFIFYNKFLSGLVQKIPKKKYTQLK